MTAVAAGLAGRHIVVGLSGGVACYKSVELVRELVKAHGGTVAAFSAGADRGSEFVVRLPLGAGAP